MSELAQAAQEWSRTSECAGAYLIRGRGIGVTVTSESAATLRQYYHLDADLPGAKIRYWGHKDDLLVAGCLPKGMRRYDKFCDDGSGGVWWLTSKAGPGRRGAIQISYYCCNRAFAGSLPGVLELFPDVLLQMSTRSRLRLIVDNTRGVPHG